jgi:hypothetical protein
MQREKATATAASFRVVVVAAVVEEATLATRGEPPPLPQPAASSEKAATATTEGRMSGRRQRMMCGSFQSRTGKAHHRNLNVSALKLRGC